MTPFFVDSYEGIRRPFNSPNYIIRSSLPNGKTQVHSPTTSTKMVLSGSEVYTGTDGSYAIQRGQFLITAPGEELELTIESSAVGCCFYVDLVHLNRLISELMSEDLEGADRAAPGIRTMRLPVSGSELGRYMLAIANNQFNPDVDIFTTCLAETTVYLSRLRARLPCRRESTRRELVARLETARMFLIEAQDRPVSLQELGRASCLSRFHLNRSFTRIYGIPPLRFHQNLRLDAARERLKAGVPQGVISAELGFSTPSSFSRAYRRHHRRPPSADLKK